MSEHVRESGECGIVMVDLPAPRVLGQMQRQRAVRTKQAEEQVGQLGRFIGRLLLELGNGRFGKGKIRLLSEPHLLLPGPPRCT